MLKILGIAALLVLGARPALGGGIGIYTYPEGGFYYCATILPNVPILIYVLYVGQGGPSAVGAEYRITGMPGERGIDYVATLVPAPGSNINLGSAFGDASGHNVAWPAAQPFDSRGNLLLATWCLMWIADAPLGPTTLEVAHREPPTNALFPCPLIVNGNFELVCVSGGPLYVNSPGANCGHASDRVSSASSPCATAVEKETWTRVRGLYR